MKIRSRLTLYFVLFVMSVLIARSFITYSSLSAYNNDLFYSRLHARAVTTAMLLIKTHDVDSALMKKIDRAREDLLLDENITIYDSLNREIYSNNDTMFYKVYPELFKSIREDKEMRYTEKGHKIIGFLFGDQPNEVVIIAGAVDKEGNAVLSRLFVIYIAEFFGFFLVVSFFAWLLVGKSLQPLNTIVTKVNTMSPVEKSERIPEVTEKDEISELIKAFNRLFDRLEDSFKLQKNFVANVSHELNNPLAKIKSQIEVSLIQERTSTQYKEILQSLLEDTNEMIELVRNLLSLSRLTSTDHIVGSSISIDDLMFESRDNVLHHFPNYRILVEFENPPEDSEKMKCYGNKQLLITGITNIIENACKYSPDKTAKVKLYTNKKELHLEISDNGPGIPQSDLPHIFEVFYRVPSLEKITGHGIGLALASRIMKAHGFNLTVESVLGKGTKFTVSFSK